MKTLNLSDGRTVQYQYDPQTDALTLVLEPGRTGGPSQTLETDARIRVSRSDGGELVSLRVDAVQDMLLEGLARWVIDQVADVAAAPDAAAAKPDHEASRSAQARETEPPDVEQVPEAGAAAVPEAVPQAAAVPEAEEDVQPQATERPEATPSETERKAAESPKAFESPERPEASEAAETTASSELVETTESPEVAETTEASEVAETTDSPEVAETTEEEQPLSEAPVVGGLTPAEAHDGPEFEGPEFADFGLEERLARAIADMGFEHPTPIQQRAIPPVMAGEDLIGLAQTGTGKTLAFVLPALQQLLTKKPDGQGPYMLVLAPTRELALQVAAESERTGKYANTDVVAIVGGRRMGPQIKDLKAGPDVVVATPGRLLDHLNRRNLQLTNVRVLVLDEADRMLDMGFIDDIRSILRQVNRDRQTLLFGATLPPAIESLSKEFQNDPVIIEVARQKPPESIEQVLFPVQRHLKTPLLAHILEEEEGVESVIVFTEMKRDAAILARQLRERGLEVALMHGDRKQSERESALRNLRSGQIRFLVATNVAARGLDIDDISHVINFDMPNTVDEYVHRIGRTARATASGKAYSFVTLGDAGIVARIESALERELEQRHIEEFDYDVPTPSWARPSARAVQDSLTRPKGKADVSRFFRPR